MDKDYWNRIFLLLFLLILISICAVSSSYKNEEFDNVNLDVLVKKYEIQTETYNNLNNKLEKISVYLND